MFENKLESSEYRAWRDRFLRQRLKWCLYLSIPCILTFFIYESFYLGLDFNLVEAYVARLVFILLGIAFYLSDWGKRHPRYLLLWASWTIITIPDIWMMLRGLPTSGIAALNLVFIIQTTFLPIYWRVHAVSQSIHIFVGLFSLFISGGNLTTLDKLRLPLIYWLWLYVICIMAVYFYERLQQQEFELRRELNVLLHSVSHDLRTPVIGTSIVLQSFLKQAKRNKGRVSIDSSILERLLAGCDRQLNMIDSLLDSQNATQNIELNYQPCNLNSLILSILLELEPILQESGAIVSNKLTDIPVINADSLKIWRVFNNLITNACKHNPDGIQLTIDAAIKPDFICIYIIDNGVGIAPKQQAKLFELYSRGARARYMPGMGMGLYICRQIILAHGGAIGVDSYPNKGSSFWFTLPTNHNKFPVVQSPLQDHF